VTYQDFRIVPVRFEGGPPDGDLNELDYAGHELQEMLNRDEPWDFTPATLSGGQDDVIKRYRLEHRPGQRPVPDQLIIIQHTRHETSGSPASTAATTHRKPNESGSSILAAHDQHVPGIRQRSSSQAAGVAPDLGQRNRVYLVTAVLPTPHIWLITD
jgi:hypothetical protein